MTWKEFILQEQSKDYYKQIVNFIEQDKKNYNIFPNEDSIFTAFKKTPLDKVKVVILGQDPYIKTNQAHGLSFSVNEGIDIPPSLRNIFKELKSDINSTNTSGCLLPWAKQGVFLLNAALTVRENQSNSHQNIGWHTFTDAAISLLNEQNSPIVFILWGNFARFKKYLITNSHHLILESSHPSPLSAHNGFFGSKPFSKTNQFLIKHNLTPIDWNT